MLSRIVPLPSFLGLLAVLTVSARPASGQLVAVGQQSGPKVTIVDVSNPAAPVVRGTVISSLVGIAGVSSVAVSCTRAVVGEQFGPRVLVLDISAATPTVIRASVATGLTGVGSVAASGSCAIAGESNGNRVRGIT